MNKLRLTVSLLLFICTIFSHAQRRNANGYKLVKTVSVNWHEKDGTAMDFLSSNYSYSYDDTGALIGIVRKFKDGNDHFMENYKKEGKQVTCAVLKNGKAIPKYSLEFGMDHKGKIKFRKEVYPVYDNFDGGIAYMEMLVSWYRAGGVDIRGFTPTDDNFNMETIMDYGEVRLEGEEKNWGLYHHYSIYLTKDNKVVGINYYNTDEYPLTSWNGDLYPRRIWSDEDVKFILRYFEYSDKLNDTNINFFGFSDQNLNSPFRNAELLTEWGVYRSKHLMLKEGVWGKDKNGNDRYHKSWEYFYDSNGNITEIKIVDKETFNRYCIVKLEYVY